jgi:branched-chain amino acid transport system substrate-binding protein
MMMKKLVTTIGAAVAFSVSIAGAALAGDTVKIGIVAPFSGTFAIWGKQFKDAIEVYVAQNGTTAGGHEVEFIYRDSGGPNPSAAKSLAQELIIKDQVDYLGGFVFTPNALAVAPLIQKSKTPTVIFNAATSIITTKSDYFVRTGFTLWQVSVPMANWAWDQGIKSVVIAVSDYGPGKDAQVAFTTAFEKNGGKVLDAIRMPLSTTDFGPFMQRIKDQTPDAVFGFLPAGPPTYAFVKSYNENGLRDAGVTFLGTGETDETNLQALGDGAIGLTTAYHYSAAHDSDINRAFTAKLAVVAPGAVANLASVGAYDGVHVIYAMIAAAGTDGDAAVASAKGMAWESPRGPVSIDPDTRHITQNVYIRRVARNADGQLINQEFQTIEAVPDLGLQ